MLSDEGGMPVPGGLFAVARGLGGSKPLNDELPGMTDHDRQSLFDQIVPVLLVESLSPPKRRCFQFAEEIAQVAHGS